MFNMKQPTISNISKYKTIRELIVYLASNSKNWLIKTLQNKPE